MSQSYLLYYCYCTYALALILVAHHLDGLSATPSRQVVATELDSSDYPDPDVFVSPSSGAKAHRSSVSVSKTKRPATPSGRSSREQADNRAKSRSNYLSDFESDDNNSADNNNYNNNNNNINSYTDNDDDANNNDNSIRGEKVINLLRRSNLLLPSFGQSPDYELLAANLRSSNNNNDNIDDDQIANILRSAQVAAASSAATDAASSGGSDTGKIIHAPTHHHHYYLNHYSNEKYPQPQQTGSSASVSDNLLNSNHQLTSTRGLHPGDPVYGSYEQFAPIGLRRQYHNLDSEIGQDSLARQQSLRHTMDSPASFGMMLNKTNDIYFLIMVGAFCVMAMAMVLAAGMFAYRIQKQRKSPPDTDYPTYGVVGPSIMNGKCGAAAFVGGYLGGQGPGGASASIFGSKSGSKSHLADSVTSGDSGLVVSEKSNTSKRAGSSPSSLERHRNSTTSGASSNQSDKHSAANFLNNHQSAARMYQHYQNSATAGNTTGVNRKATSASDLDSEDENDDGSYTVYECPGLASAHEMEIKNPLFNDDRRP